MKRTAKSVLLVMLLAVVLFALTGCMGNKLVATKTTEDSFFGKYEETVEIKFKKDKADTITMTMEFEEEEKAKSVAALFDLADSEELEGMEVEQKGKKVIMTMDAKAFSEQQGIDDNDDSLSKDSLKKSLEEDGYKVK